MARTLKLGILAMATALVMLTWGCTGPAPRPKAEPPPKTPPLPRADIYDYQPTRKPVTADSGQGDRPEAPPKPRWVETGKPVVDSRAAIDAVKQVPEVKAWLEELGPEESTRANFTATSPGKGLYNVEVWEDLGGGSRYSHGIYEVDGPTGRVGKVEL